MRISIGIDASNIRAGGGVTHLQQLLTSADPDRSVIDRVVVYGGFASLEKLPERDWLHKTHISLLDGPLVLRSFWQQFFLPKLLICDGCNVLFSPGGTLPFRLSLPGVTMSQNMLPFESGEARRFGVGSLMWFKLKILRWAQSRSMKKASGLIFLTDYAKQHVLKEIGPCRAIITTIPHGIEDRFFQYPRKARSINDFSWRSPFRFLYVSIIDVYKHQWQVARSVWRLRSKGYPVVVDFIGPSNARALKFLMQTKKEIDPQGDFIFYRGPIRFDDLHAAYHDADTFIFASSCENLPNILLEAMASGLPIASSDRGPMTEVLGKNGEYFNPEDELSIADSLEKLIKSASLREQKAKGAYLRAQEYSWRQCAKDTLTFIADIANADRMKC